MPSYTISQPGDYLVWAAPLGNGGQIAISAEYPNGQRYQLGQWSASRPLGDPRGGPVAHIAAEAGTRYFTDADDSWLIVRRLDGMRVEFDSQEPR
jgi:hypothetical protein